MRRLLPILLLLVSAGPAFAHVGHGNGFAFWSGLVHPLRGADHILAMAGVGIWAGIKGGKACWAWPLVFVSIMALGGCAGLSGFRMPYVEVLILLSVAGLGLTIGLRLLPPLAVGAALCDAHGSEIPYAASTGGYMLGVLLATSGLHGAGVAIGGVVARHALLAPATGVLMLVGTAYLGLS
jgi:urease accessory protein